MMLREITYKAGASNNIYLFVGVVAEGAVSAAVVVESIILVE